jgi:hypothetical protein
MRFAPEVECGLDGVIKDRDNPGPKVTQNKKITERINEIPTEQQQIGSIFFWLVSHVLGSRRWPIG